MPQNEVVLRFKDVSFRYEALKPILEEVSFSVRRNSKITIMGQNGGGKSTMFQLIAGGLKPDSGDVAIGKDTTIAIARQVIPRDELDLTAREFFEKCFSERIYNIDPKIDDILEVVNLKHHEKMHDRKIRSFSGGQQARLLLASALIQNPDLLLLDEPTNNLDKDGIAHLTQFLKDYKKTAIVISHDADFLNAFTDGVLYLDVFTKKVEQYAGNYFDVVEQITIRNERENRKNAQLAKEIQQKKDQANVFAHKGGQLRFVAKRMRERAEFLEENKVEIRKEDKAIRQFFIPAQEDLAIDILAIKEFSALDTKTHKPAKRKTNIKLGKNQHLLLQGPNGIGKSTLLELIAEGKTKGLEIAAGTRVGYYRQDFSTLNFEDTVYDSLTAVAAEDCTKEHLRSVAAGFFIDEDLIRKKIGSLSEGQKGLVAFARLVLQKPGLLILDEPTNHINFRHIPVIAEALNKYQGAMVLVSHVPEFTAKIRIDEILDLEK